MIGAGLSIAWQFVKGLPWQVWLIAAACLAGYSAYTWGRSVERAEQEAARDRAIAEAVMKAVEAERHAQAQHDKREAERHSHTTELREAAAKAPVGRKSRAVINAIREQQS